MNKIRFKVFTLAAAVVIQASVLAPAVFAADAKSYTAVTDFSTTQSADSTWLYEYNDGSGFKKLPVYYKDWSAWTLLADPTSGPYSNVYKSKDGTAMALHPDVNKDTKQAIDVAVAWKAPSDGSVSIPATTVSHIGNNDPDTAKGTKVWIELNGKKYDETALKFGESGNLTAFMLNVKQGDEVRFVANNNKRGGNNETDWPISLSFTGGAAAATDSNAKAADNGAVAGSTSTANANPKTGDTGMSTYGILAAASLTGLAFFMRKKFKPVK